MGNDNTPFDLSSLAPPIEWHEINGSAHFVQFYEGDAFLLDAVDRFIGPGLGAGDAAVVIATKPHQDGLAERLRARGLDVTALREQGLYVPLDAVETLSQFTVDGSPDETRFGDVVGGAIARAAEAGHHARVRAFGEMVALLYAEGKREAAVRVEELWNDLAGDLRFSLLCAYPIAAFDSLSDGPRLLKICGKHSHVIPADSFTALASTDERLRAITQLQQKASALEAEIAARNEVQARLAAIVETSDDAVVGKTLDGIVTTWNTGAERIFGYTAEEMIGQPISRLIPWEQREDFRTILATIRRGERVDHFETERVRKDGRRILVSLTVSPIKDSNGRLIGASKVARDVTERRRMEAEREELLRTAERARVEAEAANRAKDEFLAMLGHELRNPLAAVRNALVSARLDGSRRERALDIAGRQADQLARLVDDLLDVARVTQGRVTLRKQTVWLASIVEQAVETTRQLVEERAHTVTLSLPPEGVPVDGDATRLQQVIVNLITNAAKYTEPGGRIEVMAEREDEYAVLRVRDNGIGIAADMLPHVFDAFAQAERTLDRAQGGLGIGLTVARRLIELHGGRIEARSEGLGKGTEFVVRLPALAVSRAEEHAVAPASREQATFKGCARVLLVEDQPDVAEALMMLLELLGHHVRVAHDGTAALDLARVNLPDVMLVDIGLPGIDGHEVARRVRQDPALKQIILVALTGYGRDEDKQQAMAAGFDYHLVKPIDIEALHGLVVCLGRRASESGQSSTLH